MPTSQLSCHDPHEEPSHRIAIEAWRVLAKWLNHSRKHSNETVEETFQKETSNFFICSHQCWSDGTYYERRSYKKGKGGVKLNWTFSVSKPPPDSPHGQTQTNGHWTLFKLIDIFSDSATIREHSPSGLSTQASTPTKQISPTSVSVSVSLSLSPTPIPLYLSLSPTLIPLSPS